MRIEEVNGDSGLSRKGKSVERREGLRDEERGTYSALHPLTLQRLEDPLAEFLLDLLTVFQF